MAEPPGPCKEKHELMTQIRKLGREMAAVQRQELDALLAGTTTDNTMRMENARELHRILIKRLHAHITEHGC